MKATSIYGPPGTGKTTKMMTLVEELLAKGYAPSEIMYLSFTKAATGEVLRRMKLTRSDTVCTIHSACYRLMGMNGAAVVNYGKLIKFGKLIGVPFKGHSDDVMEQAAAGDQMLAIQSVARNRLHTQLEEYENSDRPVTWAEYEYFCEAYDGWKAANGLIDFTDMLDKYRLDPREHGCRVIFIDESQDLSYLQWSVIRSIVGMAGVELVYFAGDDDQAIYEWAGANPHGMAEFEEHTQADRIILDQSYRVPGAVHQVVTDISSRMMNRVDKKYAARPGDGTVEYEPVFDPNSQAEGFILARTHSLKQSAEAQLIEARVPFLSDGGGLPGPFSCKAAKAIRAWKRCKDSGTFSHANVELMIASATDRVRGDLIAGDFTTVMDYDPMKIFKMPHVFVDYFRDVDIFGPMPRLVTSTIHASKGREAPNVTLITDWTGRVAAGMALNPDAEHRVWYVGSSRAKEKLTITSLGDDGYSI